MIIPFIAAVMRDVFEVTPPMLKESAYGLGSTTWEVVWRVVLPYTKIGVIGGIMLGLGRALGETMAVTFVIGNANRLNSLSLFAAGNSITSALANEFTEAAPGLHQASLIELGLILFLITFVVLALSKLLLLRLTQREGATHEHDRRRVDADAGRGRARRLHARRKRINVVALTLSLAAMAFGLFWLVWILGRRRCGSASAACASTLFTQMTPPPQADERRPRQRDLRPLLMVALATLIGTPIGILAGIYLAEYGQRGWLGTATRFINDILLSAPSIVIGLFVYAVVVAHVKALLRLGRRDRARAHRDPGRGAHHREHAARVPNALREAAYALGTPKWKVIMHGHLPRRARRHRHRRAARRRAHRRRDRAAALHGAEQPVLVHRHEPADGQPAGRRSSSSR